MSAAVRIAQSGRGSPERVERRERAEQRRRWWRPGATKKGGAPRCDQGAELVEFALVFPLIMLVLAGILDMGFLFKDYEVVTNAAREGARMATLPGWDDAEVQARVAGYLSAGGLQPDAITTIEGVTIAIDANGRTITGVRVTVLYPHKYMILGPLAELVGGASFSTATLRAVATMRAEVAAGF